MKSFEHFLSQLSTIPDPRRAERKLYQLPHVLLFSIFAIVSGANSYRGIRTFIKVHRPQLNRAFKIRWKRPPAHTAIRYILQGLSPADVENVFRQHAADLNHAGSGLGMHVAAFDGKALKGSFDNFNDIKAKQVLSAFAVNTALVLAHIEIDEKSNEIPAVQKLLALSHPSFAASCDVSTSASVLRIVNAGSSPASSKMIEASAHHRLGYRRRVLDPTEPHSFAGRPRTVDALARGAAPKKFRAASPRLGPRPASYPTQGRFNQMAFRLDFARRRVDEGPADLDG